MAPPTLSLAHRSLRLFWALARADAGGEMGSIRRGDILGCSSKLEQHGTLDPVPSGIATVTSELGVLLAIATANSRHRRTAAPSLMIHASTRDLDVLLKVAVSKVQDFGTLQWSEVNASPASEICDV